MATEQSCKIHLIHIDFEEGEDLYSQIDNTKLTKEGHIIFEKNLKMGQSIKERRNLMLSLELIEFSTILRYQDSR